MEDMNNIPVWNEDELTIRHDDDVTQLYQQLGYEVEPIVWRGSQTNRRIISRRGRFIADVSDRYTLLPNEVVADIGVQIGQVVGAELFIDRSSENRLYQYYLSPHTRVGPKDELSPGFLLMNSVDGSMSCRMVAFLFRWACKNGQIMGKVDMAGIVARHTAGLRVDLDTFLTQGQSVMELAMQLAEAQKLWPTITLESDAGYMMLEAVRDCPVPNIYRPEYAQAPTQKVPRSKIPAPEEGTSLWDMYNDITASLTRPPGGRELGERTRVDYHMGLVKALRPALGPVLIA